MIKAETLDENQLEYDEDGDNLNQHESDGDNFNEVYFQAKLEVIYSKYIHWYIYWDSFWKACVSRLIYISKEKKYIYILLSHLHAIKCMIVLRNKDFQKYDYFFFFFKYKWYIIIICVS